MYCICPLRSLDEIWMGIYRLHRSVESPTLASDTHLRRLLSYTLFASLEQYLLVQIWYSCMGHTKIKETPIDQEEVALEVNRRVHSISWDDGLVSFPSTWFLFMPSRSAACNLCFPRWNPGHGVLAHFNPLLSVENSQRDRLEREPGPSIIIPRISHGGAAQRMRTLAEAVGSTPGLTDPVTLLTLVLGLK